MKKYIFLICLLLIEISINNNMMAANKFEVNSIVYTIISTDNLEVEASLIQSIATNILEIPSKVYNEEDNKEYVVVKIGDNAFTKLSIEQDKLQELILPNTILEIGNNAFTNCPNLTKITYSQNLLKIGDSAFSGTGLEEIYLPDSIEEIGEGAFRGLNLRSIHLGANLKIIQSRAFYKNIITPNRVYSVIIPSKVEYIGGSAFDSYEDDSYKIVVSENPIPPHLYGNTSGSVFPYDGRLSTLYVPDQSIEEYRNAWLWQGFGQILPLSEYDFGNPDNGDTDNPDNDDPENPDNGDNEEPDNGDSSSVRTLEDYNDGSTIIYDLSGRKLSNVKDIKELTPGFYIINGKKYLLK